MAAFTAVVGAIIGAIIASEIGVRRTEKRLRRLISRLMPQLREEILRILSDEEIKERARKWIDDVLIARAPDIVRNLVRAAVNGAAPKLEQLQLKLSPKEKVNKSETEEGDG